jgi:hypothetical protein
MRDHPLPVEINSLAVGADGELKLVDPLARPIAFTFKSQGATFTGGVKASAGGRVLGIAGTIGPMPYSVESAGARRDAFAILFASTMSQHTRLCLSMDRRISAVGEIGVEAPLTPKLLVAAAVRLVLELEPYIRLFGDYADPRPASGSRKSLRTSAMAKYRR